ncbi:hypothetical protein [Sphingomonas hankookensis]|uniref:terminase small subunit-like protein n=1 Tax=Sphingomonas hankookensis TaxID=563996 RepID=UPI00234E7DF5|nr:hypothetical protein [Sphingomonas hankookensis]WCP72193.1 hypothetical protein PPZ50_01105 [Sphingomonas hankookensis]
MDENTKQIQAKTTKVHTQTIMGELVPVVTSITAEATRNRPGQPTKRTDAIIDEICSRLEGGEALVMICNDPAMPGYQTVMAWKRSDPELQDRFNTAREEGTYALDDVAELIARKVPGFATGDFRYDDLLVSVLAQRKRYANRKRFGDKVQMDVVQHQSVIIDWNTIEGEGGDGV